MPANPAAAHWVGSRTVAAGVDEDVVLVTAGVAGAAAVEGDGVGRTGGLRAAEIDGVVVEVPARRRGVVIDAAHN